jgi:uncharacterized protein
MSVSPVHYQCQRCGNCCRWPGVVRLATDEAGRIAAWLGLSEEEFVNTQCSLLPDRRGLTLNSRPDGSCIFLSGLNQCRIQAVKPQQCRDFPNAWNFPGWRDVCEATEIQIT